MSPMLGCTGRGVPIILSSCCCLGCTSVVPVRLNDTPSSLNLQEVEEYAKSDVYTKNGLVTEWCQTPANPCLLPSRLRESYFLNICDIVDQLRCLLQPTVALLQESESVRVCCWGLTEHSNALARMAGRSMCCWITVVFCGL